MSKECCYVDKDDHGHHKGHDHDHSKPRMSYLLVISLSVILIGYLLHLFLEPQISSIKYLGTFSASIFELMNRMSWGLALGIIFVGLLTKIPKEVIQKVMGKPGTFAGIIRATLGGVLLDLCSHGVLLVGMKLYKRGLGLGQTMAFLIASPWNSISLTLILWALVGFKWMITFLLLSMVIAIISGVIFDQLVKRKILPENPNKAELPKNYSAIKDIKSLLKKDKPNIKTPINLLTEGVSGSKMILKWIFFGVIIASAFRTFLSPEQFEVIFGPSVLGLTLTLIAATIIEVCSEGSTPIASDILVRAGAPGNSFAFLMTGVSTDYTEILGIKETTRSWKIAFFLPLVTLPQIILLALILN